VLRKYLFMTALAASSATLAAQTPATTPQPRSDQPQAQAAAPAATTLTGCVYQEKNVPGRTPNVAETAGVLEDYIFVASGSAAASAPAPATRPSTDPTAQATPEAVGTSGTMAKAKMYKLEKIADEKLSEVVGKRVEVTGTIDRESGDTAAPGAAAADRSVGPDSIELPEFEVTSIREVAGSCPAAPSIK
jgi:hypothetical protein